MQSGEIAGELLDERAPIIAASRLDDATRRAAIVMTAAFWAVAVGIQTWRSWLDARPDIGMLTISRLITAAAGIGLCYLLHLFITALSHRTFAKRALALALVTPFAADATAWVGYLSAVRLAPAIAQTPISSSATVQAIFYWVWFFFAWSALYLALRYSFEVQAVERRARVVQSLAHAAQLRALHNQINPHFMFNALNSVSALMMDGRAAEAEQMIARLSEFFRATLALDPLEDIELADELRIQTLYLNIEQTRFPDMKTSIDCPAGLRDARVPALILQPMVENAVKFAVARNNRPTTIGITAERAGALLSLTVADDGGSEAGEHGLGVGLRNVRERLRSRFGEAAEFFAAPAREGGFRVRIAFPLDRTAA